VGQELFQVRRRDLWFPGDDSIGSEISQPLGLGAEEAGEAAHQEVLPVFYQPSQCSIFRQPFRLPPDHPELNLYSSSN
jgi:hypothetical protein